MRRGGPTAQPTTEWRYSPFGNRVLLCAFSIHHWIAGGLAIVGSAGIFHSNNVGIAAIAVFTAVFVYRCLTVGLTRTADALVIRNRWTTLTVPHEAIRKAVARDLHWGGRSPSVLALRHARPGRAARDTKLHVTAAFRRQGRAGAVAFLRQAGVPVSGSDEYVTDGWS